MSRTQRFEDVSGLTFTPDGSAALAVGGVKQVVVRPRVTTEAFFGDGDLYPSALSATKAAPVVTVDFVDSGALDYLTAGARGVLSWTDDDGFYGSESGGGAKVWTAPAAVYTGSTPTSKYRHEKVVTATFETYSPDGRSNPLTSSLA